MAGLEDPNVVDLVAKSPNGEPTLFIIEERPWGADEAQPDQLVAKVNTCYHYLLDGRLQADYPDIAGGPVVVRLECATDPTPEIQEVIDTCTEGLAQLNIGFTTKVNPALLSAE